MNDAEVRAAAERLLDVCRANRLKVATAESCTGGLVAAALTDVAGSSDVVECGLVVYSNAAKRALLGVPQDVLEKHGAVSRQTAEAMAQGALHASDADLAVAITGVAGPGGGSVEKPVGLVHFAAARRDAVRHQEKRFGDIGRSAVRRESVLVALALLGELASAE
jgi:nicotinamide-nucleotide amidase